MALDTPLQPLLNIELEKLQAKSTRLKLALDAEAKFLSRYITEEGKVEARKQDPQSLTDQLNLLETDIRIIGFTLLTLKSEADESVWTKIWTTLLNLFGYQSEQQSTEEQHTLLTETKPHFEEAIQLLEKKAPIDKEIEHKKEELKAQNTEIEALKADVERHTSSKHQTSGNSAIFRQFKNAFARSEVIDIANALHVFLETPNEGTRGLLSSTLKQYSEKDTSKIQPLLDRTQAVYGDIDPPPDSTAAV